MKRLLSLLAVVAFLAPALPADSIELSISDVRYYATFQEDSLLWLWNGDTYYCTSSQINVSLTDWTVTIEDPTGVFETSWVDATGATHTVRTTYDPARPHLITQARDHHVQAVRALQAAWPPAEPHR